MSKSNWIYLVHFFNASVVNLLNEFIDKYGAGIGYENTEVCWQWNKEEKRYDVRDVRTEEERVWENESIKVVYDGDDFVFQLKGKYDEFDKLIREAIDVETKKLKTKKENDIKSSI
jgi:hypothetical protein